MEELLGDAGHPALAAVDGVVPLQEAALHRPAPAVNGILGMEEGKLLGDAADVAVGVVELEFRQKSEDLLLNRADMVSVRIQNVQAMAPGELALHSVDGVSVLVIDIVAVEPGEEALLEEKPHG